MSSSSSSSSAAAAAGGGAAPAGQDADSKAYVDAYLAKLANPNILFVIARSKNRNIVVYEANMAGARLDDANPVQVYWLDIDPEYQAKARGKGKMDDREDLNFLEKKMAYGVSAAPSSVSGEYTLSLVALPKTTMTLKLIDGRPRAVYVKDGQQLVVCSVYVSSRDTWTGPKVEYVNIESTVLATGAKYVDTIRG